MLSHCDIYIFVFHMAASICYVRCCSTMYDSDAFPVLVACMYTLSLVMKSIPVGVTYASFAGLCIIATIIVGVVKFNQMPDLYTILGMVLIISGVLIVNLIGKTS